MLEMSLYLVRYTEIHLKSEPVRRRWEDLLVRDIKRRLDCKVKKERGRIWVLDGDGDELGKIFGIHSFSPCEYCKLNELEDFLIDFCEKRIKGNTFALRVKRVGDHQFTSKDLEKEMGAKILRMFPDLEVDLENPDKKIFVEIRGEDCYLFDRVIKGQGGLPLGSQGKLIGLFSGGIDSPVAMWMMMKRGCEVIPIHFDISPYTDQSSLERAEEVARVLREYQPDFELSVQNHGDFLLKTKEVLEKKGLENYTCVICKRRMYRVAEDFANKEGAFGIVTGESLGQVASQTLENLHVLDQVCSIPIYRPLIALDKIEIEGIARKIGTYEASILPAKGCEAVPKRPATKAKLSKVLEIEEELCG